MYERKHFIFSLICTERVETLPPKINYDNLESLAPQIDPKRNHLSAKASAVMPCLKQQNA
jgi:hypothetical protein